MLVQLVITLLVAVAQGEAMSIYSLWDPLLDMLGHNVDRIENNNSISKKSIPITEELSEKIYTTVVAALETSECLERLLCQIGAREVVEKSLGGKMALTLASYYTDGTPHQRWAEAMYNIIDRKEWTNCADIPCGKVEQEL